MSVLLDFLEFIEVSKPQPLGGLLSRVLLKSRRLTGAEAGTIFIVRGRGSSRRLEAADAQNDVVSLDNVPIVLPLNETSIAGFIAVTGETVFIDDLYAIPASKPFSFDPSFDRRLNYCSRSMLAFPLLNHERKVIGVVQLINRRDAEGRGPLPFEADQAGLILPFNHIVGSAVERAEMLERIEAQNARLRRRNAQLQAQREKIALLKDETEDAFQLSISLLARASEIHDDNTAHHVKRVNEYSYFLAKLLELPQSFCDEIRFSAQLHDVGKMSVDVAILRKKGRLDQEERLEMERHPIYGYQILSASDRLKMAADIALNHHERWDGAGYPHQRAGTEIPLAARIVSIGDMYDALRSVRPYKEGYSHKRATQIILEGDDRVKAEGHFDPEIRKIFSENHQGFAEIWNRIGT